MKLAWITLPWGLLITIIGCVFVFWTQALSFSNSYGQAILINGNIWILLLTIRKFVHFLMFFISIWENCCLFYSLCLYFGAVGRTLVYTFTELASSQASIDGWNCSNSFAMPNSLCVHCHAIWNGKESLLFSRATCMNHWMSILSVRVKWILC